jgi:hypothetical protein
MLDTNAITALGRIGRTKYRGLMNFIRANFDLKLNRQGEWFVAGSP